MTTRFEVGDMMKLWMIGFKTILWKDINQLFGHLILTVQS